MTVAGVDLSLTSTGMATISPAGKADTWSVKSKGAKGASLADRQRRLLDLRDNITYGLGTFSDLKLVMVESPSFGSAGAGTWDRSGLWWLVVSALMDRYPVATCPPTTLKKWITGSGTAEKNTVGVHIGRLFPDTEIRSDDAADALGLAHVAAVRTGYPVQRKANHTRDAMEKMEWPSGS